MAEPRTLEDRVLKLERELRWLRISFVLLVALFLGSFFLTKKESRESFVTDSLIIPSTFLTESGPFAGIAPSKDGKDIVLWFAQHGGNFAQTRLGFEKNEQSLAFTDARGKLRLWLGVASDGSAKIRLFDTTGKEVWSTDGLAKPAAV